MSDFPTPQELRERYIEMPDWGYSNEVEDFKYPRPEFVIASDLVFKINSFLKESKHIVIQGRSGKEKNVKFSALKGIYFRTVKDTKNDDNPNDMVVGDNTKNDLYADRNGIPRDNNGFQNGNLNGNSIVGENFRDSRDKEIKEIREREMKDRERESKEQKEREQREREHREQREREHKEQREREQREQREREQREREQKEREREQREREHREREKEREHREREKEREHRERENKEMRDKEMRDKEMRDREMRDRELPRNNDPRDINNINHNHNNHNNHNNNHSNHNHNHNNHNNHNNNYNHSHSNSNSNNNTDDSGFSSPSIRPQSPSKKMKSTHQSSLYRMETDPSAFRYPTDPSLVERKIREISLLLEAYKTFQSPEIKNVLIEKVTKL